MITYNHLNMRKHPWFLPFLSLAAACLLFVSCDHIMGKRVRGNGNIRTEDRTVSDFRNVKAGGAYKLYIAQGDQYSVKLEGDENLLQYVEVAKEGNWVDIRTRSGYNLDPSNELNVYITAPVYSRIEASGASDILGKTLIRNDEDLEMHVSGAGDIRMEVNAPRLQASISGSGNIDLKGEAKDVRLDLTGAGDAHCYDLKSENTTVDISGAGSAQVYASVKLDVHASGAGSVSYKGNATNVSQHVSGAGSVSKAD
jgi:hypothetical protein